jgi:sugar-specific transcriptional regulator TrmB
LLKKRDADVQAQLEKTQEELKKYKEQLNKQPEPAPSVVTTQSQLEEIMVSKAQERVDTEEIKTLEERVSNETDLIQKLQATQLPFIINGTSESIGLNSYHQVLGYLGSNLS